MQDKFDSDIDDDTEAERPVSDKALPSAGHKLTQQEAEAKVVEMFAAASAQRKTKKKKSRSSFDDTEFISELPAKKLTRQEAEEKVSEMFSASKNEHTDVDNSLSSEKVLSINELTEREFTPEEAEEEIAKLFAFESAKNGRKKSKWNNAPGIGSEIAALEFISIFLFLFSMRSGTPGTFSLIAILLPVIAGIGYRLIWQKLSLIEAASRCKPHMFISACFYICVILSV